MLFIKLSSFMSRIAVHTIFGVIIIESKKKLKNNTVERSNQVRDNSVAANGNRESYKAEDEFAQMTFDFCAEVQHYLGRGFVEPITTKRRIRLIIHLFTIKSNGPLFSLSAISFCNGIMHRKKVKRRRRKTSKQVFLLPALQVAIRQRISGYKHIRAQYMIHVRCV